MTLRLSHARLVSIPACVQDLTALEELDVSFNRLEALPDELGSCCKLRVVIADENKMLSLPESLKNLQALRTLSARHNRIAAVPSAILLECSSLQTIDVHGNPLTMQALRDTPGFGEFDARRRAKYSKQMDMRVLLRGSFDEGADVEEWERTHEKR
ncbi:hypothetical protein H632_c2936p1 [Helicosporidium sp. ATCC 50920]|nr:hypothetical protein H632_c2936p1 [Helicosporidium sp. ATCC 50920]|eukprot:KDD72757.1 hypothetical protein H632_c2936p1 [Helicosporidium sp. ATCC 50920]